MIEYTSFEDYKNKAFRNSTDNKISDEEIKNEMLEVVKY